jgi:hypothetical protein
MEVRHGTIIDDRTLTVYNKKCVSCGREKEANCRTIQQDRMFGGNNIF